MIDAVIFDMDGVLVDSEAQWRAAEDDFLRGALTGWREEDHALLVGMSVDDLFVFLSTKRGLTMPREEFMARSEAIAEIVYGRRCSLASGVNPLLDDLQRRRIPAAIASSSPQRWIQKVLRRFDLSGRFSVIACADDVGSRTKPHPDIYELAAKRLRLAPERCLAIEDSSIGLESARRAMLRAAGLRTAHNREQDLSRAEIILDGLDGIDYAALNSRLSAA